MSCDAASLLPPSPLLLFRYQQQTKEMSCCRIAVPTPATTVSSSSLSWSFRLTTGNPKFFQTPKFNNPSSSLNLSLNVEAKSRTRGEDRTARHARIRKKVQGTADRPRLCVFRSNKHLYVQVIDDTKMHTLASASTVQKPVSDLFDYTSAPTLDVAKKVGEAIAKSCLEKGITKVAFDRGGYPYHGRIEALADAARENGLQF